MAGIRRKRLHADGGCDWPYAARSGVNRIGISNVVINGFSYQKAKSHGSFGGPGPPHVSRFKAARRGKPGTVTVPRPPASHANDATRRPRRRHRQRDTGAAAVATAPTRRLGDSATRGRPLAAAKRPGRTPTGAGLPGTSTATVGRRTVTDRLTVLSSPAGRPLGWPRPTRREVTGTGMCAGPGPAGSTSESEVTVPAMAARALHHRGGRRPSHAGCVHGRLTGRLAQTVTGTGVHTGESRHSGQWHRPGRDDHPRNCPPDIRLPLWLAPSCQRLGVMVTACQCHCSGSGVTVAQRRPPGLSPESDDAATLSLRRVGAGHRGRAGVFAQVGPLSRLGVSPP
jgi:hypothetical protein